MFRITISALFEFGHEIFDLQWFALFPAPRIRNCPSYNCTSNISAPFSPRFGAVECLPFGEFSTTATRLCFGNSTMPELG